MYINVYKYFIKIFHMKVYNIYFYMKSIHFQFYSLFVENNTPNIFLNKYI